MIRRIAKLTYRGTTRQRRGADRCLIGDPSLSSLALVRNRLLPCNSSYPYSVHFSTTASGPESVRRAEADLEKLFAGTNIPAATYVATITAWIESQHPRSIDQADALFREMIDKNRLENVTDYPKVISLYIRNDEPYKAHCLLEKMERSADPDIKPDLVCYNSVLHGWCKRGDDMAMSKAEELMDQLRRSPIILPNLVSFRTMISGWGNNHTNPHASDRALEYFEELKRRYRDGHGNCKPDRNIYRTLIKLLVRSGEPFKAQSILDEMERSDDPNIRAAIVDYNSVLHCWCKRGDDVGMSKAEELFDRLRRHPVVSPNHVTFATMISGWDNDHTNPYSTDRALAYFAELKTRYMDGHENCKPDLNVYHTLIRLLVRGGEPYKAQSILDEMELSDDPNIKPDLVRYSSVLHGWCKRGDDTAMSKAEEIMDRLHRNPDIHPNIVTYGTMISGWGKNHTNPHASDRALEYFEQLKRRYRDGHDNCTPNLTVYHTLIRLLVRGGEPYKAQSILEEMERSDDPNIKPDLVCYNYVLHCWCKRGDNMSMSKAEELMDQLRRNPDIHPDIVTYGTMISGWGNNHTNPHASDRALEYFEQLKRRYRDGHDNCTPNLTVYHTLIRLLVRGGEPYKAQSILEEMERSDDPNIKPDLVRYNSVLHCWCKRGDNMSMSKAEELMDQLRRNPDIHPDIVTYGTMISGWGKNHTNPHASDRALEYFEELKRRYRDGHDNCKPNLIIYRTLIHLLSKGGKPYNAQSILEEMERSDDPGIRPDINIYNSVLEGWCSIGDNDAMTKAEALYDGLRRNSGICPDIVTFRTMISGWRKNHRNPHATARALAYFDDLKKLYRDGNESCKPDIAVYKSLIHLLKSNGEFIIAERLNEEMKVGPFRDQHVSRDKSKRFERTQAT